MSHGFPILFSLVTGRTRDRLTSAIGVIADALEAGEVRNAAFNEAKAGVNSAIEKAWTNISRVYLDVVHAGSIPPNPAVVLYYAPARLSSGNVIAKLAATGLRAHPGPFTAYFERAADFGLEISSLAAMVNDAKALVVMGRNPSDKPAKPVNPHQVRGTCPCCERSIAVVGGVMAKHGYTRPGIGWQTASCLGERFQPIERSPEGAQALAGMLAVQNDGIRGEIENINAAIKRAKAEAARAHRVTRWEMERNIARNEAAISRLLDRVAGWKLMPLYRIDGTLAVGE